MTLELDRGESAAAEVREALDELYKAEDSKLDRLLDRLQAEALREDWLKPV